MEVGVGVGVCGDVDGIQNKRCRKRSAALEKENDSWKEWENEPGSGEDRGSLRGRVDRRLWHVGKNTHKRFVPRGYLWKETRETGTEAYAGWYSWSISQYGLCSYLDTPPCVHMFLLLTFSVSQKLGLLKIVISNLKKILLRNQRNILGPCQIVWHPPCHPYQTAPVSSWDRSWWLLIQILFHRHTHTATYRYRKCSYFYTHLTGKKQHPTNLWNHFSFCSKLSWYWLEPSLPGTHFPSLPLTDCPTLHLSPRHHPSLSPRPSPSISSIVAISYFALHGFWLQPRGDFASSTECTYELTRTHMPACTEGEKKNTCLERICLSNVLSNHVEHFMSGHIFLPQATQKKEFTQECGTM